ncbi:MAG: hypothetical protein KF708_22595, partial [Pirellulales bacterium]|nr:hypothetical protein [Pirellulales bacterium]
PMSSATEWSRCYARQARADFDTFVGLSIATELSTPECHRLLFLQMACEKLTKASLCGSRSDPKVLQTSHAYTRKNLPPIIQTQLITFGRKKSQIRSLMPHIRHLAHEIELLAPAVKRDGACPDNCEYPWEDAHGHLHSPLDEQFAAAHLIAKGATGRIFLKAVSAAIDQLVVLKAT